jgi:hypothetical protein
VFSKGVSLAPEKLFYVDTHSIGKTTPASAWQPCPAGRFSGSQYVKASKNSAGWILLRGAKNQEVS